MQDVFEIIGLIKCFKRRLTMDEMKDIDNIIALLDGKCEAGVSRIKVNVSEEQESESVTEQYHRGRCDVGSPWATGKVRNFDQIDGECN